MSLPDCFAAVPRQSLFWYGGPEGTTLLLENVVSFCKNETVIFRIEHLSLEFCHRSLSLRPFLRNIAVLWKQSLDSYVEI